MEATLPTVSNFTIIQLIRNNGGIFKVTKIKIQLQVDNILIFNAICTTKYQNLNNFGNPNRDNSLLTVDKFLLIEKCTPDKIK